jgi:predicted nucleic-acid-binding protein
VAVIAVDTNILVRLLVVDDEKQTRAAARYLSAHCSSSEPALLSDIVLVECAWVLSDVYEYSRAQIGDAIDGLLATAQLRAANPVGIGAALQRFRASTADFADCLIGVNNLNSGCEYTATFDRKASKLPEFRLLS